MGLLCFGEKEILAKRPWVLQALCRAGQKLEDQQGGVACGIVGLAWGCGVGVRSWQACKMEPTGYAAHDMGWERPWDAAQLLPGL